MNLITFCINVSTNEFDHFKLLFYSLEKNLNRRDHEILIFVDSDKNNTIVPFLKSQKKIFSNLIVIRNNRPIPVGYQTNINYMFQRASYDVVSYIQSDMAIGPDYDLEVVKHLQKNTVLSSTRIEPPLHPSGPEKYTVDFGTDPNLFRFDEFVSFCKINRSDRITNHFFAPFTLYKETWNKIGGHDVQFRRSREDSDVLWRLLLSGAEIKQCWNSLAYHFTCVSSRGGADWWKPNNQEAQRRNSIQIKADQIELMKFIHKWGTFKHPSTREEANHYKYEIGARISNCTDPEVLLNLFPLFQKISVDNESVLPALKNKFDDLQKPANTLIGVSDENWNKYGKYYNQVSFENVYGGPNFPLNTNVVVEFDLQSALFNPSLSNGLHHLQQLLHENVQEGESCQFEMEGALITVNELKNCIGNNIYVNNPEMDLDLEIL